MLSNECSQDRRILLHELLDSTSTRISKAEFQQGSACENSSGGILSEVSIMLNKLNQIYLMDLNIYQVEGHQVRSGRQHKSK